MESDEDDGKEPYPPNIDETTQGHPPEPHMTDDLILDFTDNTLTRAREALRNTDQHDEQEYLSALITVIKYHQDPEFDAANLL